MNSPKRLCVIPARGGSKRIPGKNIKDFLGKPVIFYSIQTALDSGLFDMVLVSTDSKEIAELSRKFGAVVPFLRSDSSSDDNSPLSDVIDEVHLNLKKQGDEFEFTCCILPAAPLILQEDLKTAFHLMVQKQFHSVRPVVEFSYPIQRAYKLEGERVEFLNPEYTKTRSQDLPKAYHDAGQFYWMQSKFGLKGENKGAIIIPETRVQDIDTLEDWKMAELKYKFINNL